jgi:outer membrane protein assembly factor BamB
MAMTPNEPTLLICPACGAPLNFDGLHPVVRCSFCGNTSVIPAALTAQRTEPASALDEISRLVAGGNLDAAVERYCSLFGVEKDEAGEAVEALSAGRVVTASAPGSHTPDELTQTIQQVQRLLQSGHHIEAVKLYKDIFDVDLNRAEYAIDQIAAGRPGQASAAAVEIPISPIPKLGRIIGLSVTIFIIVIALVVGLVVLRTNGFARHYYPGEPDLLITSGQETGFKLAGQFYDSDADENFVGLIDTTNSKLLWKTGKLEEGSVTLAQSGDLVYTANGANLIAYHLADGSLAWQTEMNDSLNYSDESLLVTAGRVIADTSDQSITAYDAANGNLIWSRKLNSSDRTLRLMENSLVVLDSFAGSYDMNLFFIDPVTGDTQQMLSPTCPMNDQEYPINSDTELVYDKGEKALFLVYQEGCVKRIDLVSMQETWNSIEANTFNFLYEGFTPLVSETSLYFSNGSDLVQVAKSNGEIKVLLNNADYNLVPLAQSGDTLVVRAKRTRGTTRFELWRVNPTSGAVVWQRVMESAEPIDPPDEMAGLVDDHDWAWTWRMTAEGLLLLTFKGEPNQLVVETLNPADGTSLAAQTLSLSRISGDFYSIPSVISWQGNVVYLDIENNLYTLDVSNSKLAVIY